MVVDIEKEDHILSKFLQSIGQWRKQIVIGGGYALIIYKLYLTDLKRGNPPVGTRDLDSLIPRKILIADKKDIATHLVEAGFKHISKDYTDPATEAYVKEINGSEVEIEFLTDDQTRGGKDKNIAIAGVVAQPLPYLKQSLANFIEFKTFSGEVGKVVSPHAWIFHKGLTFPRRSDKIKIYKDLYGIWYASTQLQDLSLRALCELKTLEKEHPKWAKTFQNNLHGWVKDANPADWIKLEAQDPFGALKKVAFIHLVDKLAEVQNFNMAQHPMEQKIITSEAQLGSILTDRKGKILFDMTKNALSSGGDVNDDSRNGHRPLQLLIRASLNPRLKLELVKEFIDRGADIHFSDKSGLTPFQVAVAEGNKEIADLLLTKGARRQVPPGSGYMQYYKMYHQFP